MSDTPPQGSRIEMKHLNGYRLIVVPHGRGNGMRYLMGVFLLFWMGAWALGFMSAFDQVTSGKGGAFLVFWLGAWTIGGAVVACTVYRLFRKSIPEQLLLTLPSLSLDTGVPPLKLYFGRHNQKDYLRSLFATACGR